MPKRIFTGVVVKAAMNKTVMVRVDRRVRHERYSRTYTVSRKFPVHDEKGMATVGQMVQFVETRPLSKTKRWRLVEEKKA